MNKISLMAGVALAFAATSAVATPLLPGQRGVALSAFDFATQGELLNSVTSTQTGLTFAGTLRSAVYRNTLGTMDFYYQFARSGAGTVSDDPVEVMTGANFSGFAVDIQYFTGDIDGAGQFTAQNAPGLTYTGQRSANGGVVGVDFNTAGLSDSQTTATYIFRTDATAYTLGTFGVIDGSTISGQAFAPGSVPEASTWAAMVLGFGFIGGALRRARRAPEAWPAAGF